jgi:hypothetical protein
VSPFSAVGAPTHPFLQGKHFLRNQMADLG